MHDKCSLIGQYEYVFALAYIMNSVLMFILAKHLQKPKKRMPKVGEVWFHLFFQRRFEILSIEGSQIIVKDFTKQIIKGTEKKQYSLNKFIKDHEISLINSE